MVRLALALPLRGFVRTSLTMTDGKCVFGQTEPLPVCALNGLGLQPLKLKSPQSGRRALTRLKLCPSGGGREGVSHEKVSIAAVLACAARHFVLFCRAGGAVAAGRT